MIFSPHLDDAVLSTFTQVEAGEPVMNIFAGVPPAGTLTRWDRRTGATDSAIRARERLREDAVALARYGIRPTNLELLDGANRQERLAARQVARQIELAWGEPPPRRLFAPLGAGVIPHLDHELVRDAAIILARAHGLRVILYADQPYVYLDGCWPPWITAGGTEASWWRDLERVTLFRLDVERCETATLDDRQCAAKISLMREYRTQFDALNIAGVLENPALYGIEAFWKITP